MSLQELEETLAATKQERNDNISSLTVKEDDDYRRQIKALMEEIQRLLTVDAMTCVQCGLHPVGRHHYGDWYEVACVSRQCTGRQSRGDTIVEAVSNWNDGRYFRRDSFTITRG